MVITINTCIIVIFVVKILIDKVQFEEYFFIIVCTYSFYFLGLLELGSGIYIKCFVIK